MYLYNKVVRYLCFVTVFSYFKSIFTPIKFLLIVMNDLNETQLPHVKEYAVIIKRQGFIE